MLAAFFGVRAEAAPLEAYGHLPTLEDVTISPDGNTLASGSYDGTIRLWNLHRGKMIWSAPATPRIDVLEGVTSVSFRPDGRILASSARDGIVRLWDVASGHQLQTIYAVGDYTGGAFSVSFSTDGKTLAVGTDDTDIHFWTVEPIVPLRQYMRVYQFEGVELTPLPAQNLYGGAAFRALPVE